MASTPWDMDFHDSSKCLHAPLIQGTTLFEFNTTVTSRSFWSPCVCVHLTHEAIGAGAAEALPMVGHWSAPA